MSSPQSRNSPTFFKDELKRALDEQTFGIEGYTLGYATAFEASARVTLLEKIEIDIVLSIRGFQVTPIVLACILVLLKCASDLRTTQATHMRTSSSSTVGVEDSLTTLDAEPIFETVDALLQHLSPMYATKRAETLYAKLMV